MMINFQFLGSISSSSSFFLAGISFWAYSLSRGVETVRREQVEVWHYNETSGNSPFHFDQRRFCTSVSPASHLIARWYDPPTWNNISRKEPKSLKRYHVRSQRRRNSPGEWGPQVKRKPTKKTAPASWLRSRDDPEVTKWYVIKFF